MEGRGRLWGGGGGGGLFQWLYICALPKFFLERERVHVCWLVYVLLFPLVPICELQAFHDFEKMDG